MEQWNQRKPCQDSIAILWKGEENEQAGENGHRHIRKFLPNTLTEHHIDTIRVIFNASPLSDIDEGLPSE